MYVTAHRVVPPGGEAGVNAFLHHHGADFPWPADVSLQAALPETTPGELVHSSVAVKPGGNRVRSYLDVLAPDLIPPRALLEALDRFAALLPRCPNPCVVSLGEVLVRFGVEVAMERDRGHEYERLRAAVEGLIVRQAV